MHVFTYVCEHVCNYLGASWEYVVVCVYLKSIHLRIDALSYFILYVFTCVCTYMHLLGTSCKYVVCTLNVCVCMCVCVCVCVPAID